MKGLLESARHYQGMIDFMSTLLKVDKLKDRTFTSCHIQALMRGSAAAISIMAFKGIEYVESNGDIPSTKILLEWQQECFNDIIDDLNKVDELGSYKAFSSWKLDKIEKGMREDLTKAMLDGIDLPVEMLKDLGISRAKE